MKLQFGSKHPHNTLWLEIIPEKGEDIKSITDAMEATGWKVNSRIPPEFNGGKTTMSKKGSDIFAMWTKNEYTQFSENALKTLGNLGYHEVGYHKYTPQELF